MSARLRMFDGETPEDLARIAKKQASERGRYSTATAADELLTLVDAQEEPRREALLSHITLVGATTMIRKAAHERPEDGVVAAAAQLKLGGLDLNGDISVPTDKGGREYVQLTKAKPAELEAAALPVRRHGLAAIANADRMEMLAVALRELGGEDATIESLIRDGVINEDDQERLFGS